MQFISLQCFLQPQHSTSSGCKKHKFSNKVAETFLSKLREGFFTLKETYKQKMNTEVT